MREILSERLVIAPIRPDDAREVEDVIFSDPEVVKGLAHDGSTVEARQWSARRWCAQGPDGENPCWPGFGMGIYAVRARDPALAPDGTLLGVGGFWLQEEAGAWSGELFYAFARAIHGRGVGSEAGRTLVRNFFARPRAGALHAVYWHVLNPASGRILRGLGFRDDGFVPAIKKYPPKRLEDIRRFEIWRLGLAAPEDVARVIEEVGIKLGHLAQDGIGSVDDCIADMTQALAGGADSAATQSMIAAAVRRGASSPAMAMLRRAP